MVAIRAEEGVCRVSSRLRQSSSLHYPYMMSLTDLSLLFGVSVVRSTPGVAGGPLLVSAWLGSMRPYFEA